MVDNRTAAEFRWGLAFSGFLLTVFGLYAYVVYPDTLTATYAGYVLFLGLVLFGIFLWLIYPTGRRRSTSPPASRSRRR